MAFSAACLYFPFCMLSLLVDVWLCACACSSLARSELQVPFQPSCLHSLVVGAGFLWDQLLQEFLQKLL